MHTHDLDSDIGNRLERAAAQTLGVGYITGVAWYDRIRRWRTPPPGRTQRGGLAVRRDWPATGHDFVAFGIDAGTVARWIARDAAYWRPGPVRPSYSLVRMSAHDFRLHARHRLRCNAPDYPQPLPQPAVEVGA